MDLEQRKRIITISIVIALLILLGFLIWRYFTPTTSPIKTPPTTPTSGRIPGQPSIPTTGGEILSPTKIRHGEAVSIPAGQVLTRLTDFSVIAPSLSKAEDKIQFYKKDGGDLLTSDFNGERQEKISNLTIVGLIEAIWSPRRDRAAVFYTDREDLKGFLHIGTSSVAVLPQKVTGASWSPDGTSLAYLVPGGEGMMLVTADASGKNGRTILSTPLSDISVQWSTANTILLQTAPSGLAEGYLFVLSRSTGTLQRLLGPLFGLTSLPSPNGSRILISTTNASGRALRSSLYTPATGDSLVLPFQTIPEKCVFTDDSRIVYCAVPRTLSPDIILPDSYLRGETHTADEVISFDIEKRGVETIFRDGDFDIANLIITKTRDRIFFVDRNDGTLWGLQLK